MNTGELLSILTGFSVLHILFADCETYFQHRHLMLPPSL